METMVIRWKLNEVMAQKRIRNKDLAEAIGVTATSVHRLRKTDFMPRMLPERLNAICRYLQCQPGDLLIYIPDDEPQEANEKPQKVELLTKEKRQDSKTSKPETQDIAA
ncbi:helix-turn-helix domain-containing protein [Nostoc flagelliforme]|nr:helix-turn-helix domain-containing protein [Nostoc flagelliforme]